MTCTVASAQGLMAPLCQISFGYWWAMAPPPLRGAHDSGGTVRAASAREPDAALVAGQLEAPVLGRAAFAPCVVRDDDVGQCRLRWRARRSLEPFVEPVDGVVLVVELDREQVALHQLL